MSRTNMDVKNIIDIKNKYGCQDQNQKPKTKMKKNLKIAVFPGDDIESYVKKGEIKRNYFNPNDMFSEVYIFNFSEKKELDKKLVQYMCGKAKYRIIFLGNHSEFYQAIFIKKLARQVVRELAKLKPDCLRSFGILFNSYVAAYAAKELSIPYVISLHDHYNDTRFMARDDKEYMKYLFYIYWHMLREPFILRNSTIVLPVYDYAKQYALELNVPESKIEIIYNKVDTSIYRPAKDKYKKFTIINTLRQNKMKNQKTLIEAVAGIKDVELLLIGSGPLHEYLKKMANDLGCSERVKFLKSVINTELPNYYAQSHIFCSTIIQGGVGIPDLEAMACGTPVIHTIYPKEPHPDVLEENAIRPKLSPQAVRQAILKLKNDKKLYAEMVRKGLEFTRKVNYKTMSDKEEKMYNRILRSSPK